MSPASASLVLCAKPAWWVRPPRRFRRTTDPDEQAQTEDLVQRQFTASAPDQKWFGDITYVRTWEGWLYLAVILDAYSRKVV